MQVPCIRGESGLVRTWERKPFPKIFPVSRSITPSAIAIDRFPILKLPPPSRSHNTGPGLESWLHTKWYFSFVVTRVTKLPPLNCMHLSHRGCKMTCATRHPDSSLLSRSCMWRLALLRCGHTSQSTETLNTSVMTVRQGSHRGILRSPWKREKLLGDKTKVLQSRS